MSAGVPVESIALYARWWQIERWLRDLAYLNLRAAWGVEWEQVLHSKVQRYAGNDDLPHLAAPDNSNLLAYLDFGLLRKVIADDWQLFDAFLPKRSIWEGRVEELSAIRNRIGHLRRPHADDRSRLEQTLRDFEPGARNALAAVSMRTLTDSESASERLARDFRADELGLACDHLRTKYHLEVGLTVSCLPWADTTSGISGTSGFMWNLSIGGPERVLLLSRWSAAIEAIGDMVIFAYTSSPLGSTITFPAVDETPRLVSALLRIARSYPSCTVPVTKYEEGVWEAEAQNADFRVLVDHPLALISDVNAPGVIFGA